MHQLSSSTVRLITSSQVITSVASAVKELVENSLDAGSTSIEVKLENCGLDKIEVRDNGCGVPREDVEYVGRPHYTSKLTSTEDFHTLSTYGFRGEALGSLCSISDVTVTTKTPLDDISSVYTLDHKGHVTGSKPSHLGQGTSICALNLFKNLPVRKQFYNTPKKKKECLKQVEELIISFAVVCPSMRFVFKHGKETLWQANPVPSSRNVLHGLLGAKVVGQLVHLQKTWDEPSFEMEAYLPSQSSDVTDTGRTTTERLFVYVNNRPVQLKPVEKILKEHYSESLGLDTAKYPVGFLHITTASKLLDVNLEPNKTKVLFQHQTELLKALEEEVELFYSKRQGEKSESSESNKARGEGHHGEGGNDTPSDCAPSAYEVTHVPCSRDNVRNETHQYFHEDTLKHCEATKQIFNVPSGSVEVDGGVANADNNLTTPCGKSRCHKINEENVYNTTGSDEYNTNVTGSACETLLRHNDHSEEGVCLKSHGKEAGERSSLFSLDDSLDDLLLTNESVKNSMDIIELKEKKRASCNEFTDSENNNLISSGDSFNGFSLEMPPSEGNSRVAGVNDSSFVTSTRLDSDTDNTNIQTEGRRLTNSDFHLFDDSDDLMMLDIDTPVKNQGEPGSSGCTSSWSKGTAVVSADGSSVQPVKLLQPALKESGASLITSMATGPQNADVSRNTGKLSLSTTPKQRGLVESPYQPTLFDCSGASNVKKPTSAYIYFSRDIRPKVVEENPGASFQDIARIVGERWKALTATEREVYQVQRNKDIQRYKEAHPSPPSSATVPGRKPLKRKKSQQGSSPTLVSRQTKCRQVVQEETVEFSMVNLRNRLKLSTSRNSQLSKNESEGVQLIRDVEISDLRFWIGIRGNHVIAFQPIRAKELLIYNKLMQNHALPMETLHVPIIVKQSDFKDTVHWETLQRLVKCGPAQPDPYCYFTDDKLLSNGFKVRQLPDQSFKEEPCVEVVGLTRAMNYFGVSDLKEVLASISLCQARDGHCSLRQCRPAKIEHFLQAEAVRMARQLPVKCSLKDAEEILQSLRDLLPNRTEHCFHRKPFLLRLYDLGDIPLTQTQSQAGVD